MRMPTPSLRDMAKGLAQFALGGEVESVGGLVEEEHLRLVDEGAGDHDAALSPADISPTSFDSRWAACMR